MESLKVISFLIVIINSSLFAQEVKSTEINPNKSGFSLNANYIYNLSSNKKPNTWIIPYGKIANDNSDDSVYYMTFRNVDTKTFGVNFFYNKAITKNLSFSVGIGFIQRKNITKYDVYIDSNINKPNKLNYIRISNSIIIPLKMNYFINRFCFSVGNNFGLYHFNSDVTNYETNFKRSYQSKGFLSGVTHIESISYQIFKNKFLFLNLSAEQTYDFYKTSGYNNWFMLGATYSF